MSEDIWCKSSRLVRKGERWVNDKGAGKEERREMIRKDFMKSTEGTVHLGFHSEREGLRGPSVGDDEGVVGSK
jgi:hypothetical protein